MLLEYFVSKFLPNISTFRLYFSANSCVTSEEYPELERLRFNYRPDLSDHEQALSDLKKFKQKCNMRDRITEAKITELESKSTMHTKQANTLPETAGKRLKEYLKQEEPLIQESTSKPRALLTTFVCASQCDDEENDNGSSNNSDNYETSKECKGENLRSHLNADNWKNHSEKKVRWQQECVKSNIMKKTKLTETKNHIETTFSSMQKPKGSLLRQSFGSSDKSKISTTSTRSKYDAKESSGGKERAVVQVARSSSSNPTSHTNVATVIPKKVSSTTKLSSASTDGKKRTSSSRQSSGISSQERSSKLGRRRKRSSQSGGASVGSKSNGHRDFDDDEYNFKF